jgi:2,3-bisphosphoglycerate-dependent phosphoglycerate mutase
VDLVIVRHGEPVRIEPGTTSGAPADPELTHRGRDQAQRVAAWLAHERFDALLVSPKLRAIETAQPISERLALTPIIDEEIIEYDRNADHYIPIEEMRAAKDPRLADMIAGRWDALGGEAPEVFRARMDAALSRIIHDYAGQRVVAVCHGGVANLMLALAAGLDRHLWFEPAYTSISRIVASRSGVRSVVSINETGHLVGERHSS